MGVSLALDQGYGAVPILRSEGRVLPLLRRDSQCVLPSFAHKDSLTRRNLAVLQYQTVDAGVFYAITAAVFAKAMRCVVSTFVSQGTDALLLRSRGEIMEEAKANRGRGSGGQV